MGRKGVRVRGSRREGDTYLSWIFFTYRAAWLEGGEGILFFTLFLQLHLTFIFEYWPLQEYGIEPKTENRSHPSLEGESKVSDTDRIWLQDTKGEVGCKGRGTCQNLEWNGHKFANNDSSKMPTITYFSFAGLLTADMATDCPDKLNTRNNSSRKRQTIKSQPYNHHNVPCSSKNESVHVKLEQQWVQSQDQWPWETQRIACRWIFCLFQIGT